jgi:hypothetical protein
MGSKTPPSTTPSQDAPCEDDASGRSVPPDGSAAARTLRRVAAALQVPPSTLYSPLNAVSPTRGFGNDQGPTDLDRECAALLHAYRRIPDPEKRQRLLAIMQETAERA